ncbi:MAG: histidine phosphatase family protein [Aggregatilineales bacterium]
MSKIIIIRHSISQPVPGESAHTWQLTEGGHARCLLLAKHLQPYDIGRVFSSDEPKAIQTADALIAALSLSQQNTIEPDLQETRRDSVPFYDSIDDFRAAIQAAMQNPDDVVFGEETFTDATARFTNAVHRLIQQHPNETLALVTHGTVMSLFIAAHSQLQCYETWRFLEMPAYAIFDAQTLTLDVLQTSLDAI